MIRGGLSDAAVVATCDLEVDKARRLLEAHGEGVATANVDEALQDVDAAWVCTPTAMHQEVVERCVASGVAIYCEKPLARDLKGAEKIARLVQARLAEPGRSGSQSGSAISHR